jgi:hypothetical protein
MFGINKRPTRAEFLLIFGMLSGLLILSGAIGFGASVFGKPQDPETAAELLRYSAISSALGFVFLVLTRLARSLHR